MGEPTDGRCTDYCNDPAVVYHAHDLPRCKNVADVQIKGRWLCNTHAKLSTTEAALAESRGEVERRDALLYELNLLYAGLEQRLRRTVEGICNARSLQHAQEIATAALEAPHEST